MTTVNTLVLINSEQRAHILDIDARHPGRVSSRAVVRGFEFMHTPLRDFALISFVLDGTIRFANETAQDRANRLCWDPAGEEVQVSLDRDFHDAAVRHFTALELEPLVGFSVCLWYGLMGYHCKVRSLREAIWSNYPRRQDDPMSKLLNDGKTYAGQAYLANTGPGNRRCSSCGFYQERKGVRGNELDGSCDQYATVMRTGPAPRFPSSALACKHYEEKADAK